MRFDKEAQELINNARKFAEKMQSEYFTLDHLVYVMARDVPEIKGAITRAGADLSAYLAEVEDYIRNNVGVIESGKPKDSKYVSKLLPCAQELAHAAGRKEAGVLHLFKILLDFDESTTLFMLSRIDGVDVQEILSDLAHRGDDSHADGDAVAEGPSEDDPRSTLISESLSHILPNIFIGIAPGMANPDKNDMSDAGQNSPFIMPPFTSSRSNSKKSDGWKKFLRDVTEEAKTSTEPFIGRAAEIERTCNILCRKVKNNPIHIGEPGVGKTALVMGLAKKILSGDVPDNIKDNHIYELDLASVVAGTEYRGQFEARLKAILNGLEDEGKAILYIDEIHTLIGAGESSGGKMGGSNIIKQYLTRGKLKVIGATTREEYAKYFETDKALTRRFMVIDVEEPSRDDAVQILMGLKEEYEKFHKVTYSPEAIEAAVDLSIRHIHDRFLPDKAIDLIDEAGAYINSHMLTDREVTPELISTTISKSCKIPAETVKKDELSALKNLEDKLKGNVFGQDEAVDAVSMAVKMSRAGLTDETKPTAAFLFVGPTGCGKTELALTLAKELNCELIRFDMSEYQESHTVSKLIGSPAGYVGYEEEGLLTHAVRTNPNCVLLFDEIEKAHRKVYDIMLQIMDYGMLTDSKGKKISFRNAIIIFTSNAGAADAEKGSIGFNVEQETNKQKTMLKAVQQAFSPEFRNRLSGVITFNYLTKDIARMVVSKEFKKLDKKLVKKGIAVSYSDEVYEYVLSKGFNRDMGAREIARVIEREIKPLFMNEILFNLKGAGNLRRYVLTYNENDGLVLKKLLKVRTQKNLAKDKVTS